MRAKSIDFVTAAGQIIWTEKIRTVLIPLSSERIELHNVVLASRCNSNLILLEQLRDSGITYYDNPDTKILMRNGKVIAHTKRANSLYL